MKQVWKWVLRYVHDYMTNDCDVLYTLNVFLRSSNIGLTFVTKINTTLFFFMQRVQGIHTQHLIRTDKNIGSEAELQGYEEGERLEGSYFYCEAL